MIDKRGRREENWKQRGERAGKWMREEREGVERDGYGWEISPRPSFLKVGTYGILYGEICLQTFHSATMNLILRAI